MYALEPGSGGECLLVGPFSCTCVGQHSHVHPSDCLALPAGPSFIQPVLW